MRHRISHTLYSFSYIILIHPFRWRPGTIIHLSKGVSSKFKLTHFLTHWKGRRQCSKRLCDDAAAAAADDWFVLVIVWPVRHRRRRCSNERPSSQSFTCIEGLISQSVWLEAQYPTRQWFCSRCVARWPSSDCGSQEIRKRMRQWEHADGCNAGGTASRMIHGWVASCLMAAQIVANRRFLSVALWGPPEDGKQFR